MTLSPGTKLGPYEVVAPLGAGGMGEVYRARDARLSRDVAIKVLPEAVAQDPERLARFEREARLLASLDHPNIARILGLEELGGARGLVLELAEGEDLSARIERGALPAGEAIAIALQIARALEHAHERGIVHRDLKPANVKLARDGAVKVLDFGLARAFEGDTAVTEGRVSQSPTITRNMTTAGLILGTAAYMSPEQARGRTVDRRADIWSFGVVLFEMLTGARPFGGETVSETLASVIKDTPDFSALPAAVPPAVRRLVERCLTREPADRLRDIGEARIVLAAPGVAEAAGAAGGAATGAGPRPRRWLAPAASAALAVAATAAALFVLRPAAPPGPVRRFRVPVSGLRLSFFAPLALTRDGRALAFEAGGRVWIRRADSAEPVEVPGSEKGRTPFWSWDQSMVCFSANKKLWSYTPGSDQPRKLCDIPESGEIVGGAWGADGRIVLAVWRGALYQLPAGGGEARVMVPLDSTMVDFHGPTFLPDGHAILLFVHMKTEGNGVAIVEGNPPRLTRVFDAPKASSASYSPTGHLLVEQEENSTNSSVWAVPFSLADRKSTGPAFRVLDGAGNAACGTDGMLVALEDEPTPTGQLAWRRRDGGRGETIGEPQRGLSGPTLSPDGGRVAYAAEEAGGSADIWVQDLLRGTKTRLTSSPFDEEYPAWTPDGTHLYYASLGGVMMARIVRAASDGSGTPDTVGRGHEPVASPDGKTIAYVVDRKGNGDLWTLEPGGQSAPRPFLAGPSDEEQPCFSPDGHWLAYASDESGRLEVYIRRFPEGDSRAQVSVNGGMWPRWTRRGDGIYYVNGDTLLAVPIGAGPRPSLGLPRVLFSTTAGEFGLSGTRRYGVPVDAHPDGARFIGVQQIESSAPRSLVFVENWIQEFRKP